MAESSWPVLTPLERRVLGVLIEKQKTSKSADTYPLTLNSLTTGCNQKSNRDPLMELDEDEVEETLGHLLKRGLVSRVSGGRVERWKHEAYTHWTEDRVEMAILAELLLRGPQSEGDLRSRVSRMEEIESLDALRSTLRPMADRGLVVYLTPAERRGAIVTHGFHDPQELAQARAASRVDGLAAVASLAGATPASSASASSASASSASSAERGELAALRQELTDLRGEVADLRGEVAELRQQLLHLQTQMGQLVQLREHVVDIRKQLGLEPTP
jgi:uncharacterized protein YceH (UPF0502 family)